jgi:hypothetical protein
MFPSFFPLSTTACNLSTICKTLMSGFFKRNEKTMKQLLFVLALIWGLFLFAGCEKEKPVSAEDITPAQKPVNSCEGCHTNYAHLKAVHTPDIDEGGGGGCGGETPHIEPYDRVFLGGSGYSSFKKSMHGKLDCTLCHNGVDNTDDKNLAHSGDFIKAPSKKAAEKCGSCHASTVMASKNSLHEQGWGQKNMVTVRAGVNSFEALSEAMKNGYDKNCGKCHASCGDCHVNNPKAGGGGLMDGHNFARKPDMRNTCVTCHTSRGGHAYFGIASGTVPDVHLTKAGFDCMSCHPQSDVHGDGKKYALRYEKSSLPQCQSCHPGVAKSNMYHVKHITTFNCNTCHSQDYNNCGSCHIGGEGARKASYQGFKIGVNPLPELKPFKFATLRQSLTKQDSWQNYGITNLANFDAAPTYKYTTPHNIIKWTSRTKVAPGKACFDACHIIKEGNDYRNKELYLFKSDLEEWEFEASKNVIVDGKLPGTWNLK